MAATGELWEGMKAFAIRCNASVKTVKAWIAKGMPHRREGRRIMISPAVAIPWVATNVAQGRPLEGVKAGRPMTDAGRMRLEGMARKAIAEAEIAEMDLAARKGRLVDRAEVEDHICQMLTLTRNRFMAIPNIAGLLEGKTAKEIFRELEEEVRSILNQLASGIAEGLPQKEGGTL